MSSYLNDLLEKLTVKERAFCEAYCSNGGNATKAYRQGGYSANSDSVAGSEAHKLLKKPKIQSYIQYLQSNVSKRFNVTYDRLVQELAAYAFADPVEIFDDDGQLKPLSKIPEHVRKSITEVQIDERYDSNGNPIIKRKAKTADRLRAIELLLKVTGATSELNTALSTLKLYGIDLLQKTDGTWEIQNE